MRTATRRHNSMGPRFQDRRYYPSSSHQSSCVEQIKMAANLPYEFNKFTRYTRQLRHILRETKLLFHEINKCGIVDGVQVLSAELPEQDVEEIELIVDRSPSLIVLGQNTYSKAFIINELFNQSIVPSLDDHDASRKWRQVRFKYGAKSNISLCLPGSYELVENLAAYNQSWRTVPLQDIELKDHECRQDRAMTAASMEVSLNHQLLKDGVTVIMTSQCDENNDLVETVKSCMADVLPILIYAMSQERLSDQDIGNLKKLKEFAPHLPVFFVQVPPPLPQDLTESARHNHRTNTVYYTPEAGQNLVQKERRLSQCRTVLIFQQLCDLTYLSMVPRDSVIPRSKQAAQHIEVESEFVEKLDNFCTVLLFVRHVLQAQLIRACTLLNSIHTGCLQNFILTAFDMTRDMLITPRRIEFAKEKESDLYLSLMDIAMKKQDEIKALILDTIETETPDLLKAASDYQFTSVDLPEDGVLFSAKDIQQCSGEIKELILNKLNAAIAGKLTGSVDVLRDSYTGTLTRCLASLEKSDPEMGIEPQTTTFALQQILNAAYQVEITVRTSSSLVKLLLEKMKQIVQSLPWSPPPNIDAEWKQSVAADMLNSLSESKLARSICVQIRDRLKNSHDAFLNALRQLEYRHSGRLEKTEDQRLKVRKVHAPRVARMALESVSLRDMIMYGMPQLGREVGRGQYGVVYACDSWAGYSPCAIKSVVPPDEKHWNDLALEFYYTKNIPEHDRLVPIFGSVVDYSYGGGSSPAVLLVMPRLQRDLYTAIKSGLDWPSRMIPAHERLVSVYGCVINYDYGDGIGTPEVLIVSKLMKRDLETAIRLGLDWANRLQVALDVVEGIRFLHSQGLVHRDIKLKNVLLDKNNRGAITDLGFCKPEAMMSGSIVGTPIHMSPELFTGKYDNSVDVYAFGILFWYICAGHVRLPFAFEQCTSKDMLWNSVKKGVRPERLGHFEDECWQLMTSCWEGEPDRRPLLGHVQPILQSILARTAERSQTTLLSAKWKGE